MSVNKFATIKNAETGETIVECIAPPNAMTSGDVLSRGLYALSELVIRGLKPNERAGGFGGDFGYACEFENEVFEFHPDYQHCSCPYSEDDWAQDHVKDCRLVMGLPNFRHKTSGLEVRWYKWIGRDVGLNRTDLTGERWVSILRECYESIPLEAREKAEAESKADVVREADPEYQRQRAEAMNAMFRAMDDIHKTCEREGHNDPEGHCHRCGLVTDFERGTASIRASLNEPADGGTR